MPRRELTFTEVPDPLVDEMRAIADRVLAESTSGGNRRLMLTNALKAAVACRRLDALHAYERLHGTDVTISILRGALDFMYRHDLMHLIPLLTREQVLAFEAMETALTDRVFYSTRDGDALLKLVLTDLDTGRQALPLVAERHMTDYALIRATLDEMRTHHAALSAGVL